MSNKPAKLNSLKPGLTKTTQKDKSCSGMKSRHVLTLIDGSKILHNKTKMKKKSQVKLELYKYHIID